MKSTIERDLQDALAGIFRRHPELTGFSIQEGPSLPQDRAWAQLEGELFLADAGIDAWQGGSEQLLGEVAVTLLDFIEERPEARELLRGRTFARVLH